MKVFTMSLMFGAGLGYMDLGFQYDQYIMIGLGGLIALLALNLEFDFIGKLMDRLNR